MNMDRHETLHSSPVKYKFHSVTIRKSCESGHGHRARDAKAAVSERTRNVNAASETKLLI